MYPTLFKIGGIEVGSYYVFWIAALYLLILWGRFRASSRYGVSDDDYRSVMLWVVIGTLVGARIGGYGDFWSYYQANPEKIWRVWEGAMSSGTGFLLGGMCGIWKLRRLGLGVAPFAEAIAVPMAATMTIGRIGCFLEGCCMGVACPVGLKFPDGIVRYPSQLVESVVCALIFLVLFGAERKMKWDGQKANEHGALLWPAFMVLYGMYRIVGDIMRDGDRILGFRMGQYAGVLAVLVGTVWIMRTLKSLKEQDCHS